MSNSTRSNNCELVNTNNATPKTITSKVNQTKGNDLTPDNANNDTPQVN